ncbi:MAG: GNAT family N-acetyltransferase [Eubacterium sp.]
MIEKIENETQFSSWEKRDIYSVRILALLKSYGLKYHFATFYRQVIEGKTVAVISKLDSDITLSLSEGFNSDELIRFFCITGFTSILCSDAFEFGARYDEGFVMSSDTKREAQMPGAVIDEYPKLMDLYNFVDYDGQDFKAWYVDISHRVRHGTAKAYTLCIGDDIVSSGILSAILDEYAVLTAVRTDDKFRHMGYGSALVNCICSDVKGTVYIMRDADLNENFYKRLGFKNIGKWRIYK